MHFHVNWQKTTVLIICLSSTRNRSNYKCGDLLLFVRVFVIMLRFIVKEAMSGLFHNKRLQNSCKWAPLQPPTLKSFYCVRHNQLFGLAVVVLDRAPSWFYFYTYHSLFLKSLQSSSSSCWQFGPQCAESVQTLADFHSWKCKFSLSPSGSEEAWFVTSQIVWKVPPPEGFIWLVSCWTFTGWSEPAMMLCRLRATPSANVARWERTVRSQSAEQLPAAAGALYLFQKTLRRHSGLVSFGAFFFLHLRMSLGRVTFKAQDKLRRRRRRTARQRQSSQIQWPTDNRFDSFKIKHRRRRRGWQLEDKW